MGGGDKALKQLGDRPILDHVIERLSAQCAPVALNANGDPSRFQAFGLPVIADQAETYAGPLAGVLAGLDWAAGIGARAIITVAADTPFFPKDLAERLQSACAGSDPRIVLAATHGADGKTIRHPTFGLWPVALREDLRAALADGVRKVVQWTDRHDAKTALFATGPVDPFFNVNTPEDLATAQTYLDAVQ